MDIGHAIFKGIVQGLTEFLPVSSTAHLIFTDALYKLFGWQQHTPLPGEEEFFDILLHLGTLLAVIIYFRKDLVWVWKCAVLKQPYEQETGGHPIHLDPQKLPYYIILSTTITVVFILGLLKGSEILFEQWGIAREHMTDISEFYLQDPRWVAFHLLITGGLLFFTEWMSSKRGGEPRPFGFKNAAIIGLLQGCAGIFHGVSRSGSTISAGLASGVDRLTATRYSFLLSIPTFMMAAVYEGMKVTKLGVVDALPWTDMIIGTAVSAVVGYFCVKYFILFVAKYSLKGFAYYCWTIGLTLLVLFNMV